jgi:hypothetical protein
MAIDTTEKRRDAARDLITQADLLMRSVYALRELAETIQSAGLTFVDDDFENQPGLEHVDANALTNVISNGVSLHAHLKDNFIADVFNVVRR